MGWYVLRCGIEVEQGPCVGLLQWWVIRKRGKEFWIYGRDGGAVCYSKLQQQLTSMFKPNSGNLKCMDPRTIEAVKNSMQVCSIRLRGNQSNSMQLYHFDFPARPLFLPAFV